MNSKTASMEETHLAELGTLNPHSRAFSKASICETTGNFSPTNEYKKQLSGRSATMLLSCNFKLPEAVFLGFL